MIELLNENLHEDTTTNPVVVVSDGAPQGCKCVCGNLEGRLCYR